MTVSSSTRRAGPFNGNDVTTAFPFTFKVFATSDVAVYLTDPDGVQTLLSSGYTVTLNGDQDASPGGTVNYPTAGDPLAPGYKLDLVGNVAYTQGTDITNTGRFLPDVIERAFDKVTILIQQLLEKFSRTITFPVGDTATSALPTASARANKAVVFDAEGNVGVSQDNYIDQLANVTAQASAAAGSAAAALGSENAAAGSAGEAADHEAQTLAYLQAYRATSYGALAADPLVDPNGNPPTEGDEYFNTTDNLLKRFNGATWQASDINTANLAASGGSALVGHISAGVGAVQRTLQAKLRDSVSVKDFGAVGDGATDDTSKLQAALNAGVPLYFPPGTYLTDALTIPTRACVHFAGIGQAVLKLKNNATGHLLSLATNAAERVQLRGGFTIDGNKANQSSAWNGIHFLNTGSAAAHIAASAIGSNDPRHIVDGIVIVNCKGDGVHIEGRGGSTFANISVYTCDGVGFYTNGFDSRFHNINVGGSGLHSFHIGSAAYNNQWTNLNGWFSGMVDATTSGDGMLCEGFYNVFSSVQLQDNGRNGLHFLQAQSNTFAGIYIESCGERGAAATPSGVYFEGGAGASGSNTLVGRINDRQAVKTTAYGLKFTGNTASNSWCGFINNMLTANVLPVAGGLKQQNILIPGSNDNTLGGLRLYSDGVVGTEDYAWNASHLRLGGYHLWIDGTGRLRIKSSAPTGDTDGIVVGTQA